MSAKPDSSDSLVFECDLEEPPEKVWRALTEPRLLEMWLAPDAADTSLRHAHASEYEIIAAEPHRLLRYSWLDRESGLGGSSAREVRSTVTVELVPSPAGGTHLRLRHGDFRLMAAAPTATAARPRPIMSARRRQPRILSLAGHASWKRAA